jgi:HSP20 family protein
MAVVRWEPVREVHSLQQELNRLFGSFFDTPALQAADGTRQRWIPPMDLVETDAHYLLRADLPGLGKDDVKVELDENVLTISGERRTQQEQRADGYFRIERASGTFARSLTLPSGVDADRIEANFADGVLEVRIPKPEQRKPRRVAIGAGRPDTVEGSSPSPEPVAAAA